MERVPFNVVQGGLSPANDEARAVLAKLVVGERVAAEVYRPRDNKFASRVHFVFERIAQSQGMSVRNVRGWIAALTGRADVVTINGRTVMVPWGTGPRDMSNAELHGFWDDAREVIARHIVPTLEGVDRVDVLSMLDEMDRISS